MNQKEKRIYLIRHLLDEKPKYRDMEIPSDEMEQKQLLRSLFNIRMPASISEEFIQVQDEYLKEEIRRKRVTEVTDLKPVRPGIYLWKGDITTLACDAIVNAANSGLTGCYQPCHNCIDNCIHTYAGIQLRNACAEIMEQQGYSEPTGQAKITPAYNLPSKFVIHTVGPVVQGKLTRRNEDQLVSCYRSCLKLAEESGCKNIDFCCISTGVFGFPQDRAAEIAVQTVQDYKTDTRSNMDVIFNVFKEVDNEIYQKLLG